MADVIREAVIKIGLEQIPAELKAPDLSKVIGQQREYGNAVKQTTGYQSDATKATIRHSEAIYGAEDLIADHIRLTNESSEAQLKHYKHLVKAAEGTLLLGRGFALLGASGSEDLQKVVQSLAAVQGGIDLFKGGIAIVENVSKAFKAYEAAASLTIAAESSLAAATTIRASAQLAAIGPAVALTVATMPLSVVLIGIGAIVGTGAALWATWGDAVDDATLSTKLYTTALDAVEEKTQAVTDARRELLDIEQRIADVRFASDPQGGLDDAIAKAEKMNRLAEENRRKFEKPAWKENANWSEVERAAAIMEYNKDVFDPLGARIDQATEIKTTNPILEDQIKSQEKLLAATERMRDSELDRIKNAEELLNKQERQLEAARRQLDVENEKLRSFRAQIGALDDVQKAELKRIVDLIKGGGSADRNELLTLAQTGGAAGREFAEKEFAKRGAKDAAYVDAGLGTGIEARQRDAEARASAEEAKYSEKSISELRQELMAEKQQVEAVAKTAIEEIRKMIDTLLTAVLANTEKLRIIESANANNID